MSRLTLWGRSLALGIVAAVAYGIVHDQISVRISPAYLMDWHPAIIASRNPTQVALAWGVAATWWFGLILGGVLALAATAGRRPMAPWRAVARATGFVFGISALSAVLVFGLARSFAFELPESFAPVYADLSHSGRLAFTLTAAMHQTSYDAAGGATLVAAGWIAWRRRKAA